MAWLDGENEKFLESDPMEQDPDTPFETKMKLGPQNENFPRIIYASRTHVQLAQAMKELKNSQYCTKPSIILGSRDQLCVNQDVSRLEGNTAKTHACRSKVRTGACPYHDGYESKVQNEYDTLEVVDIEDLVTKGVSKKFCPYYATRFLKQKAQVIFSPYNYLLDPALRRNQSIDLKNTVVIFDEGHNIESNCEDCASCELRSLSLEVCIKELENQLNKNNNPVSKIKFDEVITSDRFQSPLEKKDGEDDSMDLSPAEIIFVKDTLYEIQKAIEEQLGVSKNVKNNKVPTEWIFNLLKTLYISREKVDRILNVLDKISLSLGGTASHQMNRMKIASFETLSTFLRTISPPEITDDEVSEFRKEFRQKYAIVLKEEEDTKNKFQDDRRGKYRVATESNVKGWIMNLYCLSPSVAIKQLKNLGVKCVIITSGTLSPLDSFESEMELPFPVKLENKHVIDEKQLLVCAVSERGDCKFDSRFNNRDNMDYVHGLCETLIEYSRIIPDGILVFFSSYPVMNKAIDEWKRFGQYDRLDALKACFKEPQDKFTFNECLEKFKDQIESDSSRGAIFFGVCRGKLSEGLDIGNRYCRSVVMIGVPYPSFFDAKSVLKREYVESKRDPKFTGSIYYNIQMKRSLNQAIGRVIRHKEDYGAVLLLDFRFANEQNSLSKWIRPFFKKENFDGSKKELKSFFAQNSIQSKPTVQRSVGIQIKSCDPVNAPFKSPFAPSTSLANGSSVSVTSKKTSKLAPHNLYPIFNKPNNKRELPQEADSKPNKKKSNDASNLSITHKSTYRSTPDPQISNDKTSTFPDFMKLHGDDLKKHLKEGNKLGLLTKALQDYRENCNVESLVDKMDQIFNHIDRSRKNCYILGIANMLKYTDRQKFLSLSGLV